MANLANELGAGCLTQEQQDMIARLCAELDYVRTTHDIRDSLRNFPTLTEDARAMFNIASDEE